MPLYDFECYNCGDLYTDMEMPMSDVDKEAFCKTCGSRLKQRFGIPAIQYTYPAGSARAGRGGTSVKSNDNR